MDLPAFDKHTIKKQYYSQGPNSEAPSLTNGGPMNQLPLYEPNGFESTVAGTLPLTRSMSYSSLHSRQHSRSRENSNNIPLYDPRSYDSLESLFREARNLRPLYDNLYDYEAYGDDAGADEFVRRLKAFYRRHKPFFLLLEVMVQFGLCTLALSF